MAYTMDWVAKEIQIPTTDLVLVGGTEYNLPMQDFLDEIRRLEWDFADGLWAPAILDHTNSKPNFAGANYAGFDDIINEYHIHITGAATRVNLLGSNNNLVDVLIVTGVSIVPSNSAGLQLVNTGGGVGTPAEVASAVWNALASGFTVPGSFGEIIGKLLLRFNQWLALFFGK